MKSSLLFFVFNMMVLFGFAQIVPYEKLDSLSKIINNIQFATNEMSYNDGKMDYELSFAEANFMVTFHDQLAVKSVYKKWDGKEILALTENIDMSKATDIIRRSGGKELMVVRVYFPIGDIETQIIENGKLIKAIKEDYLEFFCTRVGKESPRLMDALFSLSNNFKVEKGLVTRKEVNEQVVDVGKISPADFVLKHPSSLFAMHFKEHAKRLEKTASSDAIYKKGIPYHLKDDYTTAFTYYMQAAEMGHTEAMVSVATFYYLGKGVKEDYNESMKWLFKAAESGYGKAMNQLSEIYAKGQRGQAVNTQEAAEWKKEAEAARQ